RSVHSFDSGDLVDGGEDKQIDVITIDEGGDEAVLYLIQAKFSNTFESNVLVQLHNGLRVVSRQAGFANTKVVVVYAVNGPASKIGREFKQEAKSISNSFKDLFASFEFKAWGCDELVDQMSSAEKKNRKVNAEIAIKYDTNVASLIKYDSKGLKGLVCSVPGTEIARVVNGDSLGYVFDSNVRRFLGSRGAVNSDIRSTCTSAEDGRLFWFLNNGITIVCDRFDHVAVPDDPAIKIENLQIVNGCQTATTLAQAARDGSLSPDTWVLLRVYQAPSSSLVDKIVLTTNNQNKIGGRDLRANDQVQVDMEARFLKYGLYYERKNRQYVDSDNVDPAKIVSNEIVAQSYLAVVLKRPSDARRRKYRVWGDMYDKIFTGAGVEPFVASYLLHSRAQEWLARTLSVNGDDIVFRRLANNGVFHVMRATAFLWRGSDEWIKDARRIASQIKVLDSRSTDLEKHFRGAVELIRSTVSSKPEYSSDLISALKSNALDSDIDKALYSGRDKASRKSKRK
ncbi:hypothetical protein HK102_008563, partial [Quaeritorhiza haematococci]